MLNKLKIQKEYVKNCYFCFHLGSDDAGDDWGSNPFPICEKVLGRDNLKSFPFKKIQACHSPDFWKIMEVDKQLSALHSEDMINETDLLSDTGNSKAWKYFKEKYCKESDKKEEGKR